MVAILIKFFSDPQVLLALKILYYFSWVLVPAALIYIAVEAWVIYVRTLFFSQQSYVLIEIKLPKEIFKSTKAMEFCIANMYQTGLEGNWYEKYWKGMTRSWFSLEIVSIDGGVHFFIWARKG